MSDEGPSCIEDLPNELWVEVFSYLDWINLFLAFYGINKRINQLLMSIKTLSLYSSYLIRHSNSIYVFFQEFPLKDFKQIQYLHLTYDKPYEDAFNIAKHIPSFSTLISLTVDSNSVKFGCNNEFIMIIFHEHCPVLQRLYIYGSVFDETLEILDNVCTFYFPSLLYIHVSKLHFILALQILDQCPLLRSFSAKLYGHPKRDSTAPFTILLSTRISMGLPSIRTLNLSEHKDSDYDLDSTFLERLLPCCPNIHTFIIKFSRWESWDQLFQTDWWPRAFASNNKLKRISLHLQYMTRALNVRNEMTQIMQSFQSSPFFIQLNADISYGYDSEFMRCMTHNIYIKNKMF